MNGIGLCLWMINAPRDIPADNIISHNLRLQQSKAKIQVIPPCAVLMFRTSDLTILPNYHIINWYNGQEDMAIGHHGPYQKLLGVLIEKLLQGWGKAHTDLCRTLPGSPWWSETILALSDWESGVGEEGWLCGAVWMAPEIHSMETPPSVFNEIYLLILLFFHWGIHAQKL